jgi:hypothetical protein
MSADELANTIRSAPLWLQISVVVLLVFTFVGAGPFAGYVVVRRRRQEGYYAVQAYTSEPAVQYSSWWNENALEASLSVGQDADQKFGALDVTFAGVPRAIDSSPTRLLDLISVAVPVAELAPMSDRPDSETPAVPKRVPLSEEPTEEQRIIPSVPVEEPAGPTQEWAEHGTQEWRMESIFDAEIEEAEDEATRLFRSDPLGSWVLPPLDEPAYLPEADRAFRDLVAQNILTGEGADIDAEWESWYGSRELEGASA